MTEQIDGNEMNGENTTGGFNVDRLQSNQRVIKREDYLIQGENIEAVIRNLRQARWELKHGFPMACDMYMDYCEGLLTKRRESQ